ncbi:MAG: P1 family peptidase [Clostridiales bacterium]|nr:P1 family peptidase [Clostridiales bacterium]
MATIRSISDFGLSIGTLPSGPLRRISDVPGVTVGHETIDTPIHKTGVTVILPGEGTPFLQKYIAACYVLNGFGKTTGLAQIEELGTLETPIALTNTLNVGLVQDGLIEYVIAQCAQEHYTPSSINAVVGECNDARLNQITRRAVTKEHVFSAIRRREKAFMMGDVGAGKGTLCYGWKGGIGSASRKITIGGKTYTLGVLVQSNYGHPDDLQLLGRKIPPPDPITSQPSQDKGSIMMVLATDLPVDARQLQRILKRMSVGMARLGSYIGHGSGEIMIGFTTANPIAHISQKDLFPFSFLREDLLDIAFRAAGESCEEAIVTSMLCADGVVGYQGVLAQSLGSYLQNHSF